MLLGKLDEEFDFFEWFQMIMMIRLKIWCVFFSGEMVIFQMISKRFQL